MNISDGNTHHRVTDATILGTLGAMQFTRTYVSNDGAWNGSGGPSHPIAPSVPSPFGSSPTAPLGTNAASIRWWANFYSLVHGTGGGPANLWDMDGHWTKFVNCSGTPPCWYANDASNLSERDRLMWTGSAFVLYKDGGGRQV